MPPEKLVDYLAVRLNDPKACMIRHALANSDARRYIVGSLGAFWLVERVANMWGREF